jgi:putative acetyltransferase
VVQIEPAEPGDTEAIESVLRAAFDDGPEADLVAVLREDDLRTGCSTVVRDGESVVGYGAVANADLDGEPAVELAVLGPVAVLPDHEGRGIGTDLIRASLRACKRSGCDAVVLEGDTEYYERFGFEPAAQFGLESDLDPAPGTFQVWPCWPDALEGISGIVRHPVPFHAR